MPWYLWESNYDRYRGHGFATKYEEHIPRGDRRIRGRVYEHKVDAREWAKKADMEHIDGHLYETVVEDPANPADQSIDMQCELLRTIDGIFRE